ncbi:uncharacterized protein Z518_02328 [Rhinocladiella mackenziei CBS 650.93]|uniref:Uncharacterized protein n=1 Tax=Rhinocladiella mackenziei CBS 650.93 TaxID=1442369 RepID=A0A0D2IP84_9EURO|nr:uncharacterized protein Z518_02328 [Rhinocladiella mackenziei CBS 650.93]KIX07674.1 hypothetical protein Z518_02328 [Rhinocladiella mackenziei CBS 650.93]
MSKAFFATVDAVLNSIPADLVQVIRTPSFRDSSAAGTKRRLYELLLAITDVFQNEKKHVFVGNLCTELSNRGLVGADMGDRMKVAQLVFILFGALTMLYTPVTNPDEGQFQMAVHSDPRLRCPTHKMATWHIPSQAIDFTVSFDDLLHRFCRMSPIPKPKLLEKQTLENSVAKRILKSQNVDYYSLSELLNVRICWTTSICEHLELDIRSKTLKLFRIPSYCAMLCLPGRSKTFLDSFFQKFLDDEVERLIPTDIFREVLATYRVIFGQHADARNLIKRHCSQGTLFKRYQFLRRKPHPSAFVRDQADPLLERLCFLDSRDEALFVDLDMLDLKNNYILDADFPYFADRLWALQEYVENQCPNNWKTLWRDRRDVAKFWTVWAVVVLGVPSIVLSLAQTILTGLQLRTLNLG